jgi:hypothetical protein
MYVWNGMEMDMEIEMKGMESNACIIYIYVIYIYTDVNSMCVWVTSFASQKMFSGVRVNCCLNNLKSHAAALDEFGSKIHS